jgi:DNA (cytosine-5)-methyltransferase 1
LGTKEKHIIDLFCGAGGFTLGAHLAGFYPCLSIDKDQDLVSSFKTNFPDANLHVEDLSELSPKELLELAGKPKDEIAGIIGGPPCQGFSTMGNREPDDPRNHLVPRFYEFVEYIQPAFFVMENVPGLLTDDAIDHLHVGLDLVENKYEILSPHVLNAADYGAATSRDRVFVIGYKAGGDWISWEQIENGSFTKRPTVYNALHDLPSLQAATINGDGYHWATYDSEPAPGQKGEYARLARTPPPKELSTDHVRSKLQRGTISGFNATNHTDRVLDRFSKVKPGGRDEISRSPRLKWDEQCNTLRAGTGKDRGSYQSIRPIHPDEHRVITVREAARIQGFPDWFQFHPTKWHSFRMIGNSVPPPLANTILSTIKRQYRQ